MRYISTEVIEGFYEKHKDVGFKVLVFLGFLVGCFFTGMIGPLFLAGFGILVPIGINRLGAIKERMMFSMIGLACFLWGFATGYFAEGVIGFTLTYGTREGWIYVKTKQNHKPKLIIPQPKEDLAIISKSLNVAVDNLEEGMIEQNPEVVHDQIQIIKIAATALNRNQELEGEKI